MSSRVWEKLYRLGFVPEPPPSVSSPRGDGSAERRLHRLASQRITEVPCSLGWSPRNSRERRKLLPAHRALFGLPDDGDIVVVLAARHRQGEELAGGRRPVPPWPEVEVSEAEALTHGPFRAILEDLYEERAIDSAVGVAGDLESHVSDWRERHVFILGGPWFGPLAKDLLDDLRLHQRLRYVYEEELDECGRPQSAWFRDVDRPVGDANGKLTCDVIGDGRVRDHFMFLKARSQFTGESELPRYVFLLMGLRYYGTAAAVQALNERSWLQAVVPAVWDRPDLEFQVICHAECCRRAGRPTFEAAHFDSDVEPLRPGVS